MALKKSELYSSLWQSCDELRGGMDASQYKDYVLVLLFIKYISDKYAGQPYAPITVPAGASFADMAALKGKSTIGDDINKKIIARFVTPTSSPIFPTSTMRRSSGAARRWWTGCRPFLCDMDAEIDTLEAKLAKVGNIKQGMMQDLLTRPRGTPRPRWTDHTRQSTPVP
jgi:hypothetical protein